MTNKELKEKIARLETELAEVKEMAEAMKKRADGGVFKPEDGQEYWLIFNAGEPNKSQWVNHRFDKNRNAIGNCFPTRQAAEDTVRVLKLTQKARETQNGFVPDWRNAAQDKYFVCFDGIGLCIKRDFPLNVAPTFGYWEGESACYQFARENQDDLLWYFTEYQR